MPRRTRRSFTPDFKAQLILELISGQRSPADLCRQHQLSSSLLATWKDTALEGLPTLFQGEERRTQEQTRIAELEQVLGRQTLELEILKKASRLLPGLVDKNGRS
jgi:transposase-like protein